MIVKSIPVKLPSSGCFRQLSIYHLICSWPWWRAVCYGVRLNTSDPAGSHSCMSGPYVALCDMLFNYDPPRPNWFWVLYHSKHYFFHPNWDKLQYLEQWKGSIAVNIVSFERGWRGSENGIEPCCTKRLIKTKQVTSLKCEDTSREKWRRSKSSCLLDGWQLAALCTLVATVNKRENRDIELFYFIYLFTSGAQSWHLTKKYMSVIRMQKKKPSSFSAEYICGALLE